MHYIQDSNSKLHVPERLSRRSFLRTAGAVLIGSTSLGITSSLGRLAYAGDGDIGKIVAELMNKEAMEKVNEGLDEFNRHRKIAGLEPVVLDEGLSKGCFLHARYIALNGTKGLKDHDPDVNSPGYTEEGKKAAQKAVISYNEPKVGVVTFMSTFFHRLPVLRPGLERIGFGYADGRPHGRSYGASVVNVYSNNTKDKEKEKKLVIYPVDNQKDIPLSFDKAGELPDPTPHDSDRKTGYPISITFFEEGINVRHTEAKIDIKDVKAELVDKKSKKEIPIWLLSPEEPPYDPAYPILYKYSIGIIPKDPLKKATSYVVTVRASIDNENWEKTWQFTTVKKE